MSPKSLVWCPSKKRGHRKTLKRKSCEVRGNDQRDASASQGTPRIVATPEPRKKHGMLSHLELPEGTNPAHTLILDFWAPEL